jgi:hypothetical protein
MWRRIECEVENQLRFIGCGLRLPGTINARCHQSLGAGCYHNRRSPIQSAARDSRRRPYGHPRRCLLRRNAAGLLDAVGSLRIAESEFLPARASADSRRSNPTAPIVLLTKYTDLAVHRGQIFHW